MTTTFNWSQHINDTEAALIPTASSPRERHHNHTHAHHGHVHGHSHGRTAAIDAPSGTNDDSQAPSVIVEPELGADHASIGDLWEVRIHHELPPFPFLPCASAAPYPPSFYVWR
eukprot:scaffold153350_cov30-Tisochrysis_lutea.AAC.4